MAYVSIYCNDLQRYIHFPSVLMLTNLIAMEEYPNI